MIFLTESTKEIIAEVNKIVPAYLVGGSVRDAILQRGTKDFDFCTPVHVDEVEERIKASGRRAFQIGQGKRHGTIGCKINGEEIEITTFRTEVYKDEASRQPTVEFTSSLEEDLARRDITINAMAIDDQANLIDPFGGVKDLEDGLLRFVGNAEDRIREDPLRMLRVARFASQLAFDVEAKAFDTMIAESPRILYVSKERWTKELDGLLGGHSRWEGLEILIDTGLMRMMLPELTMTRPRSSVNMDNKLSLEARWFILFFDGLPLHPIRDRELRNIYRADAFKKMMNHLKFSNDRQKKILAML